MTTKQKHFIGVTMNVVNLEVFEHYFNILFDFQSVKFLQFPFN